jgi:hypothetical protein
VEPHSAIAHVYVNKSTKNKQETVKPIEIKINTQIKISKYSSSSRSPAKKARPETFKPNKSFDQKT